MKGIGWYRYSGSGIDRDRRRLPPYFVGLRRRIFNLLARLLTRIQVAEMLSVDEKTVYRWAKDGKLPSVQMGRVVRFLESDVDAFIAQHRKGGKTDGMAPPQR